MRDFSPAPWKITRLIPIGKEDNDYPGAEISLTERGGSQHTNAIQVWTDNAEDDAELIVAAHRMYELLVAARKQLGTSYFAPTKLLEDIDAVLEELE
jgi:hypothetical protein